VDGVSDTAKLYWCEDFITAQFKYEPVITDGILAMGEKMIVVGQSESGKSYLLLQLALELATGGSFFGRDIVRPFKTMLIQSEVMEGEYQGRVRKMVPSFLDLDNKMLGFLTTESMKLNDGDGFTALREIVSVVKPDILMLDPLRAFFRGDENSSEIGEEFFEAVRMLQEDVHPFCLIMAHHVKKPSGEWNVESEAKYDARGSGIWTDRPSTALKLAVNVAQSQWKLSYTKTRGRSTHPAAQDLYVDFSTGLFESNEISTYGIGIDIIEGMVGTGEVPLDILIQSLRTEHDVAPRTAARWLNEAEQAGNIERVRDPLHQSRKLVRRKEKT
jgi:hypothetical protein